jgi:hypothetical protein
VKAATVLSQRGHGGSLATKPSLSPRVRTVPAAPNSIVLLYDRPPTTTWPDEFTARSCTRSVLVPPWRLPPRNEPSAASATWRASGFAPSLVRVLAPNWPVNASVPISDPPMWISPPGPSARLSHALMSSSN